MDAEQKNQQDHEEAAEVPEDDNREEAQAAVDSPGDVPDCCYWAREAPFPRTTIPKPSMTGMASMTSASYISVRFPLIALDLYS